MNENKHGSRELPPANLKSQLLADGKPAKKNLAVNHLPLERGLAVQTWTSNRKPDGKALITWLLDFRGSREMPKHLSLKVSNNSGLDLREEKLVLLSRVHRFPLDLIFLKRLAFVTSV